MEKQRLKPITLFGLAIAFLGGPVLIYIFNLLQPSAFNDTHLVLREGSIFLLAGILILIITQGEKESFRSIGLHNDHWGKSIGWALLLAIILFSALLLIVAVLPYFNVQVGGDESGRYSSISLWTMLFIVTRAGIVEELFYRGYLMERLNKISNGNKWVYFILPLVVFALAHYKQGIQGIIISFIAGLILAIAYWKKRDLKANIIAHFLVDCIPNVLVPALS